MPGPLPDPNRRRRNPPTIPATALPSGGRRGAAPKPPHWVELGSAGLAWWAWAWKTPQAAAWSAGHEVFVARRAELEDERKALYDGHYVDVAELLELEGNERTNELNWLIRNLLRLSTGKTTLDKEARELDDRLGLSPKGQAALRWVIVDDQPAEEKPAKKSPARRLKVVDKPA